MQTILDYTKEIVDEIYKHDDHWNYTIAVEPYEIQLITKDWNTEHTIMFSNSLFSVWTDYGFGGIDDQFDTIHFKMVWANCQKQILRRNSNHC